ncbi:MAG TPA: PQQ-dependent sugar dehydrogenase [Longimicrobiales bacterium]
MRPFAPLTLILLAAAGACSPPTDASGGTSARETPDSVRLVARQVAGGLENPVFATAPAADGRLFIVEQAGRVRVVRDGQLLVRPFLDIRDRTRAGGERGMLSVAFHPDYASNGFLYVNYTDLNGDTNVERYTVSSDPDSVDPATAHRILFVEQPYANHNGGLVAFGPDGMLYVGMGDGGSAGDPLEAAQDLDDALGKLLRLDVDAGDPYAVPDDNPYATAAGPRALVWALGLRNPWRFSWDDDSGLIFVADVGQNEWEEINAQPADAPAINYGWDDMEASECFEPEDDCLIDDRVLPVHEYDHGDGCSVTGGYVYRGSAIPEIRGHYFYADWCGGWIRSFRIDETGDAASHRTWDVGSIGRVTSFGLDAAGELYVVGEGAVYRLERATDG